MAVTKIKGGVFPQTEVKNSAYTVVTTTDSGKTFEVEGGNSVVFTLPAIAVGNVFTFVYSGGDANGSISISPAAADGITYAGSSTDNKDLVLTTANAQRGDFVTIASLDGVVAWQVIDAAGTWTKEA